MASARGHGSIIYCVNSGRDGIQTGSHNGDGELERGSRPWMEKKEKCPALDRESMSGEPWMERTGRER
ncbi:hypothetical protein TNCV_5011321 [Trichonephila clavipes]|nr:hypothetical protein TNCV_5011321 [Trichonephila clavipes]